ncbi:hypothetical protein CP981_31915 [Streptomyces platensis]|uniref:LigA protein n=1 Tax=Streptomyces platensis TaxID=58346 RepID=A0AAE6NN27_STRPT|nr:hypothetical protein [Streptomyces platensis]OSY47959.1 hypothetical protein BG653_00593 [Streptomyces platensis]QEV55618.1 hypothetical protein CP981_31915 [Streptomyces platensis]
MDNRRLTLLGRIAVVACVPYLALKLLWVLGFDPGVLDTHRIGRAAWVSANVVTFLLDAVAAVVAHTLTRPAGLRAPAWLLAFPLWMASGLLIPLMTGLAGGSATALVTGAANPLSTGNFLAPWVFGVVYGGFAVEAVTLLGAFVLYAHQRWGGLLRRPLRALPDTGTRALQRIFVVPAAVLLAALGTVHVLWGAGSTLGVPAADAASRTVISSASEWAAGLLSLAGAAGLLLLVLPGPLPGLRVRTPLFLAWCGSAAAFACGGCLWLGQAVTDGLSPGAAAVPEGLPGLVGALELCAGLVVLCAGSFALCELTAATRSTPASGGGPPAPPAARAREHSAFRASRPAARECVSADDR